MGGASIFRVREGDPNRNVIVENVSLYGSRTVMVAEVHPEIVDGDKRILIIGGEVVPFCLARIPKPGEIARATWRPAAAGSRGRSPRATARSPRAWRRRWRATGCSSSAST
jgi:glutathione synthase